MSTDILDRLRSMGLCAGRDVLQAFLTHATKARLSAVEILEQLAELERRERDAKNLAFKQWGTVFPGAACIAAPVDRFTQHCHVLDIDGESWRQHEQDAALLDAPPPNRPSPPARRKKRR